MGSANELAVEVKLECGHLILSVENFLGEGVVLLHVLLVLKVEF